MCGLPQLPSLPWAVVFSYIKGLRMDLRSLCGSPFNFSLCLTSFWLKKEKEAAYPLSRSTPSSCDLDPINFCLPFELLAGPSHLGTLIVKLEIWCHLEFVSVCLSSHSQSGAECHSFSLPRAWSTHPCPSAILRPASAPAQTIAGASLPTLVAVSPTFQSILYTVLSDTCLKHKSDCLLSSNYPPCTNIYIVRQAVMPGSERQSIWIRHHSAI